MVATASSQAKRQADDRKDKSGEKLAENEEDLLEHRTDGTDAFDTPYIGCEKSSAWVNFIQNYLVI